jgi:multidrug efflux pump
MNISLPFIRRPIATTLLAIALMLGGALSFRFLPVAALPSVDIPTIVVLAARPGADPETMANSIAAPLERRIGEIPGVTELTSVSTTGNTSIVIQFDVARDVDGAAHDIQAAINAAATDLPSDLPTRPYYRKINPAEFPILTIALTSDTLPIARIYDAVDTVLAQRLSQVQGVSQVLINGASTPAVRVQVDATRLANAGLAAQDIAAAVQAANVLGPTGGFTGPDRAESIGLNGQIGAARDYRGIVVKQSGGTVLRLSDVATVIDSVANVRLAAWDGPRQGILVSISKEAGANVIDTVDRVKEMLPQLLRWMPPDIKTTVVADRTVTIRASVEDVQLTLLVTVALVLMVVLVFMRRLMPTLAAGITVPLSIAGTLAAMLALGYSLNNFTLMAITISVGFVVDDAIVMIENIYRHIERGMTPMRAAIEGSRQIGFTVISITLSLIAVFIPLLFMGGLVGRLFREFSVTVAIAIGVSAVVSLTLTPMICARYARAETRPPSGISAALDRGFRFVQGGYGRSIGWALKHRALMLLVMVATVVFTLRLYGAVPKGLLPDQDTGLLFGTSIASPDISFAAMSERQQQVVDIIRRDPAVESVGAVVGVSSGWAAPNRGTLYVTLKPVPVRGLSSDAVIDRLRAPLAAVGGVQTVLASAQDLRPGGRSGGGQYQFAVICPDLPRMRLWTDKLTERIRTIPGLADVSSDQDHAGPQLTVQIDRATAARLGVTTAAIDDALSDAFSQRQISVIYTQRNQYRVVLEADPALQSDPALLDRQRVAGTGGTLVPLSAVARFVRDTTPLTVAHQGQFPAGTISFNTATGLPLETAVSRIEAAAREMSIPPDVHFAFAGNARILQDSLRTQPLLIAAALLSIFIVLGVLYESIIHPLTILSTIPSAGLGALLALLVTGLPLDIMGIVGIILLMGIVKKNAIMLVDFALEAERTHGLSPQDAIHSACIERFRPIIMTTLAAVLGALPLALSFGTGAELRRPLGIAIVGGLLVSQLLTLYTTPIVYLALERLARGRRTRLILPAE